MAKTCIIVADGARARFLTLEAAEPSGMEGGPRLKEHQDLVNPEADVPARSLFSDRSGSGHASRAGAAHALDDHRERHEHEVQRRYVRRVLDEAERFVAGQHAARLLVVAEPRLLGALRELMAGERFGGVEITELGEDLSRQSLAQIQSTLALRGAVPADSPPEAGTFRPRGQPHGSR